MKIYRLLYSDADSRTVSDTTSHFSLIIESTKCWVKVLCDEDALSTPNFIVPEAKEDIFRVLVLQTELTCTKWFVEKTDPSFKSSTFLSEFIYFSSEKSFFPRDIEIDAIIIYSKNRQRKSTSNFT